MSSNKANSADEQTLEEFLEQVFAELAETAPRPRRETVQNTLEERIPPDENARLQKPLMTEPFRPRPGEEKDSEKEKSF